MNAQNFTTEKGENEFGEEFTKLINHGDTITESFGDLTVTDFMDKNPFFFVSVTDSKEKASHEIFYTVTSVCPITEFTDEFNSGVYVICTDEIAAKCNADYSALCRFVAEGTMEDICYVGNIKRIN